MSSTSHYFVPPPQVPEPHCEPRGVHACFRPPRASCSCPPPSVRPSASAHAQFGAPRARFSATSPIVVGAGSPHTAPIDLCSPTFAARPVHAELSSAKRSKSSSSSAKRLKSGSTLRLYSAEARAESCTICQCATVGELLAEGELGELDCCEHSYCHGCISKWLDEVTSTCPLCKRGVGELSRRGTAAIVESRMIARLVQKAPELTAAELEAIARGEMPDTHDCVVCETGTNEDQILLCDACDRGFHTYCLQPRIESIPDGDWYCPDCAPTCLLPEAQPMADAAVSGVSSATAGASSSTAVSAVDEYLSLMGDASRGLFVDDDDFELVAASSRPEVRASRTQRGRAERRHGRDARVGEWREVRRNAGPTRQDHRQRPPMIRQAVELESPPAPIRARRGQRRIVIQSP